MKIVSIFEVLNEALLSVQYDDCDTNEFEYTMECWTDIEYLRAFFKEHKEDLNSKFYNGITVNEAIQRTLNEAEKLEKQLIRIAKLGKYDCENTLQTLFKPLKKTDDYGPTLQKSKLYGPNNKSWLRIYAIRIAPNLFVISGGAIKLVLEMKDRDHLKKELHKLELTKVYLKELGLLDENDYELLEF